MQRQILSVLLASLVCMLTVGFSAATEFGDINNPNLQSLTSGNFTTSLSRGMWLIEFFSPYCKHCKKFAPVWQDLAEYNEHLADSSDFHFARVNCITQGDLCEEQNIRGFPTVALYAGGVRFEEYDDERGFDQMQAYIEARAADWRKYAANRRAIGLPL